MPIKFRMYFWIQDMHHQLSVERSLKTNKIHTCHTNDQWQKGVSLRNTTMHMMEEYDCYICPNNKVLGYTTTTREGYRQYKPYPEDCMNCPFRNQCTKSRNHVKVINRHLWERYRERSEEIRHTPNGKKSIQREKKRSNGCFRSVRKTMDFDLPGWKD